MTESGANRAVHTSRLRLAPQREGGLLLDGAGEVRGGAADAERADAAGQRVERLLRGGLLRRWWR
jgi:hypothetical protein